MTAKDFYIITEYLNEIIKNSKFYEHVYCVGGAVRDLVMENEIKDVDIVLDIQNGGIELAQWLWENDYLVHEPVTYPTYGTSMFKLKRFPDIELEAVHTRKEQYKDKNSRNPETEYGTLADDIMRRDFTCNTLLYDISKQQILDLTGKGIEDIKNKIIRSPMELI